MTHASSTRFRIKDYNKFLQTTLLTRYLFFKTEIPNNCTSKRCYIELLELMERTPRGETESVTAVTEIILSLSLLSLPSIFS